MRKMRRLRPSCVCAKYHPGLAICSHIQMVLLADREGLDQTVRMRRLIWAFTVHICPKTRFRMARHRHKTSMFIISGKPYENTRNMSYSCVALPGRLHLRRAGYLFEVVFVKCVCIWRTSVFFQFYGGLSGVIYNYSPPLFLLLFSHTFAAENCAIGNIVK